MPETAPAYPVTLSIPKAELITLCKRYGPMLRLADCTDRNGAQLSGPRLLWALAGRESSFGSNLAPRHEPGWDVGSRLWQNSPDLQAFIARWGRAGASSYGPLQVMAFNCKGFAPPELAQYPEDAFSAAGGFLNRWCLDHWKCKTLDAICDTWNTGNPKDANVPHAYQDEVWQHYQQASDL